MGGEWIFRLPDENKSEFPISEYQMELEEIQNHCKGIFANYEGPSFRVTWNGANPSNNIFATFTYDCSDHSHWNEISLGAIVQLQDVYPTFLNGKKAQVSFPYSRSSAFEPESMLNVTFLPPEDSQDSSHLTLGKVELIVARQNLKKVDPTTHTHNWTLLWDPTKGENPTEQHARCFVDGDFEDIFVELQRRLVRFGFEEEWGDGETGIDGEWCVYRQEKPANEGILSSHILRVSKYTGKATLVGITPFTELS